ncbi:Galanin receptor type 2-like protein [Dinothrombium tinctorium]|uniref:Galanin receptor type 2-like protein n=1 Tax=Dinothrombium tinctorium TaxID=1965070 RepID=A0A3S3NQP4_9ACAR|nr:Galanin receptor type 2-like protein [Dinothrombium tinctorium]
MKQYVANMKGVQAMIECCFERRSKQNIYLIDEQLYEGRKRGFLRDVTQVIKMLIFVVLIFLLCWGPRLIMNVIIKMGLNSYTHFTYTARIACYLLSFIHSALNPFIYGFMSSNFRRMLCKTCSKRNSNHSLPTEHHYLSSIKRQSQRVKYSEVYDSTAILGNGLSDKLVANHKSNAIECHVYRNDQTSGEWEESTLN